MKAQDLIDILSEEDPEQEVIIRPSTNYREPDPELTLIRKDKQGHYPRFATAFDADGNPIEYKDHPEMKTVHVLIL